MIRTSSFENESHKEFSIKSFQSHTNTPETEFETLQNFNPSLCNKDY